jgi:hypothetical protein
MCQDPLEDMGQTIDKYERHQLYKQLQSVHKMVPQSDFRILILYTYTSPSEELWSVQY